MSTGFTGPTASNLPNPALPVENPPRLFKVSVRARAPVFPTKSPWFVEGDCCGHTCTNIHRSLPRKPQCGGRLAMDWFSSQLNTGFLADAQKKAQEAAVKARELASQASVQARALAEQATSQAKVYSVSSKSMAGHWTRSHLLPRLQVLAERAAQETSQLQARLEKLAETSAAPPPATGVSTMHQPWPCTEAASMHAWWHRQGQQCMPSTLPCCVHAIHIAMLCACHMQDGASVSAAAATDDPAELAKYGVTDTLMAYVMGNLTYSTFRCAQLPRGLIGWAPCALGAGHIQ
jgi:hypothetical protein